MDQFFVTKKKYDWIVKHKDEEFDLTEDREAAIDAARIRAKAVQAAGGEAEVLVANVVGLWDKISID